MGRGRGGADSILYGEDITEAIHDPSFSRISNLLALFPGDALETSGEIVSSTQTACSLFLIEFDRCDSIARDIFSAEVVIRGQAKNLPEVTRSNKPRRSSFWPEVESAYSHLAYDFRDPQILETGENLAPSEHMVVRLLADLYRWADGQGVTPDMACEWADDARAEEE